MDINVAAQRYYENRTDENCKAVILSAEYLVKHFAHIYGGNCCFDDLYQTGMEGLLKALSTFEQGHGATFCTWASQCIISAIRHYVRKEASFFKPGCVVELQTKVDKLINDELKKTGEVLTTAQIASKLGVTEKSVEEVMRAGLVSLDEINVDNIETVHYNSFHLPLEDSIALAQAMTRLTGSQQKVLRSLYYEDMTQEQVAEQLGVNQKKVSRLKQSGLKDIEKHLTGDDIADFRMAPKKYSFHLVVPAKKSEK